MGVMADLGVHKADIISYLLGTRITGVGAFVEAIQTNDNQTSSGIAEAFVSSLFTRDGGDLAAERILPVMKAVFAAFRSSSEGRFIEI